VDLGKSDNQLLSHYFGGMRQQFSDCLNLFDLLNMFQAHQRALHLDKPLFKRHLRLIITVSIGVSF
jgi:hypothetical protein